MAASTLSTVAAVFKTLYAKGEVPNLCMKNHPLFSRVKKVDDFYGDGTYKRVPILIGNPQGISANFGVGQANASASVLRQFAIDRKKGYGFVTVDAEAMIASERDAGAYLRLKKAEMDNVIAEMGNAMATYLYGDGWGGLAVVRSDYTTGTTIGLAEPRDAYKFDVGQQLRAADEFDSGTPRTGTMTVTAVDWDAGTITVDAEASSLAAGDFIFREGDADMAGTTKRLPTGLAGWIPLTAPSASENFFGVDRSVHSARLAGHRLDNSSNSIEENVMDLANKIAYMGGRPDALYLNPDNVVTLNKSASSKIEFQGGGGSASIGFTGFKLGTAVGMIDVLADPDCPPNRGYLLSMDTWSLHTMKEVPHIVEDEGLQATRSATADEVEVRLRWFAQLACSAPGRNGVFSIA